jgi:hypothetical protein
MFLLVDQFQPAIRIIGQRTGRIDAPSLDGRFQTRRERSIRFLRSKIIERGKNLGRERAGKQENEKVLARSALRLLLSNT